MNKTILINSINALIEGYKNNSLTHCSNTCPLCIAFDENPSCKGCPNTVFKTSNSEGCAARNDLYPKLAYRHPNTYRVTNENDATIAEFWSEVRDYLISMKGRRLSQKTLDEKILEIADKYQ